MPPAARASLHLFHHQVVEVHHVASCRVVRLVDPELHPPALAVARGLAPGLVRAIGARVGANLFAIEAHPQQAAGITRRAQRHLNAMPPARRELLLSDHRCLAVLGPHDPIDLVAAALDHAHPGDRAQR